MSKKVMSVRVVLCEGLLECGATGPSVRDLLGGPGCCGLLSRPRDPACSLSEYLPPLLAPLGASVIQAGNNLAAAVDALRGAGEMELLVVIASYAPGNCGRLIQHTLEVGRAEPFRPAQSFEDNGDALADHPWVCAYRLPDVTRQDACETLDIEAIMADGAFGAMPARLFPAEVAFLLGRAPKYGA